MCHQCRKDIEEKIGPSQKKGPTPFAVQDLVMASICRLLSQSANGQKFWPYFIFELSICKFSCHLDPLLLNLVVTYYDYDYMGCFCCGHGFLDDCKYLMMMVAPLTTNGDMCVFHPFLSYNLVSD